MKLLDLLKANEPHESLYLVIEDLQAKMVVAAWSVYAPKYEDEEIAESGSIHEARQKAWDKVIVDYPRLSELAGIPMLTTISQFNRLKDAGLIYPDGSLHTMLKSMMRAEVGRYVRGLVPRNLIRPADNA